jgi:hypothetical protein
MFLSKGTYILSHQVLEMKRYTFLHGCLLGGYFLLCDLTGLGL